MDSVGEWSVRQPGKLPTWPTSSALIGAMQQVLKEQIESTVRYLGVEVDDAFERRCKHLVASGHRAPTLCTAGRELGTSGNRATLIAR
jgi:hypothetical protein